MVAFVLLVHMVAESGADDDVGVPMKPLDHALPEHIKKRKF
jgi:hypothetical protein